MQLRDVFFAMTVAHFATSRPCAESVSTCQAAQSSAATATVKARALRQPVGRGWLRTLYLFFRP